MKNNEFEIYQKTIARRTKIRWMSLLIYLILILGSTTISLIFLEDLDQYGLLYTGFVLGGSVILIILVIFPYFNKITPPKRPDGLAGISTKSFDPDNTFIMIDKLKLASYLAFPISTFIIAIAVYSLIQEEYVESIILIIVGTLVILILFMLDTISLLANKDQILVRLGPFKDIILMKDVDTIRPVSVRPFRDFMGIGKRVGPDGAIGYIAYKKTGVRIETKDNKIFVITLDNPQEFTEFVRYFKKSSVIN